MKILLDENLPTKLKYNFGINFEIFLTIDKNLIHQQNIHEFEIKFIILAAMDNKHQTLQPYIDKVKVLLANVEIPKISEITL